ncbi:hypothetical protein EII34_14990 [Arachnia propionica]|uniref:Uncharacterized protein n=1 Tax=Arachnia propionica TaxID=1750 RepID=A0A3P1T1D5_9ACTN|nr:hypothetical protein [Arachnia propionica]RRD03210.1 hypothetical protein EII34_14990 [Arachnia propionica]
MLPIANLVASLAVIAACWFLPRHWVRRWQREATEDAAGQAITNTRLRMAIDDLQQRLAHLEQNPKIQLTIKAESNTPEEDPA